MEKHNDDVEDYNKKVESDNNNTSKWKYIAILFALLGLVTTTCSAYKRHELGLDMKAVEKALIDTLDIYKNNEGLWEASIAELSLRNMDNLKEIELKDSMFNVMKRIMIKKDKERKTEVTGVIKHITNTVYRDTGSTTIKYLPNPITGVEEKQFTFDFDDHFDDGWVTGFVNMSESTTYFDLSVKNDIDYIKTIKRTGLFGLGSKEYVITAINNNPYTTTTNLKSITVTEGSKRWGIGPIIGYGGGYGNKGFNHSAFLGVGLSYDLIKF